MSRLHTSILPLFALMLLTAIAVRTTPTGDDAALRGGTTIIAAPVDGVVEMVAAAAATTGLLEIVIPRGTYLRIQAGELDAYNLPSVMNMRVGDRIVIRNEDDFPHILMYAFVPIGGTDVRVLDDVGTEVYTAGCTPSGGEFAPFTTIFIAS